ncbi:MAG TPA: hypothetical protein VMT58_00745, partial [Candidatus Binataceae bacterium]|nr:hypothetical protein [Candidatus Binataceae bacterium]
MKKQFSEYLPASRGSRIALALVILIIAGLVEGFSGRWTDGYPMFAAAIVLAAAYWLLVMRPARIPHAAVLEIKLSGPIHEDIRHSPLERLLRRGAPGLDHLRYALEFAATDPDLRAIVVEFAGFEAGLATAHEIYRLLRAVHSRGKRVIALLHGDIAGPREYLAAAGASEIVVNP